MGGGGGAGVPLPDSATVLYDRLHGEGNDACVSPTYFHNVNNYHNVVCEILVQYQAIAKEC